MEWLLRPYRFAAGAIGATEKRWNFLQERATLLLDPLSIILIRIFSIGGARAKRWMSLALIRMALHAILRRPETASAPLLKHACFLGIFFCMGVVPEHGRSFTRDDEKEGVCSILSAIEFWMAEFGGSTESIGGPIRISDNLAR